MAALSGISVSALRFYDSAGILLPASVDPVNGYRRYTADQVSQARLVARLRRVGMPLPDIRRVLLGTPTAALAVVQAHLQRLEDGLVDARRELSAVRASLAPKESSMSTIVLPATSFLEALADVRFAASDDPELPMLNGVLLDFDAELSLLHLVATDRHRLAVSSVPLDSVAGGSVSAIMPVAAADELAGKLAAQTADVTVSIADDEISFSYADQAFSARQLDHDFPDYRRIAQPRTTHRLPIEAASLRRAVNEGPTRTMTSDRDGGQYQLTVLMLDGSGGLAVTHAEPEANEFAVGVNQEFLLQALDAGGDGQLLLELDGPIGPLAIRNPGRTGTFSILMPVRLDAVS
jgi:DNA polymerase III sliding clamp (beta) subunit (PCNA family)